MKHLQWLDKLPPRVRSNLEFWVRAPAPKSEKQDHYLVEDVAEALKLSPITVREYIRDGRIYARKLGRKWQIPADAIARYIYNNNPENAHSADDDVPMGVVVSYYDDDKSDEQIVDYRIVSDKEMEEFATEEDLSRFMGYPYGTPAHEIEPITHVSGILERLGIITPTVKELTKEKAERTLLDGMFGMPPKQTRELIMLANEDWVNMPLPIIEQKFKEMFSRKPDVIDLRFFKIALEFYSNTGLELK